MSLASRTVVRIGMMVAVLLGIARPPAALASRPATTVGVAHLSHALAPACVEIGASRYASGGGRGGHGRLAARHDAPPPRPTTGPADPASDGCVLAGTDDGRRRSPQSRAPSPVAVSGRLRLVCVVDGVHDRRAAVPGALFHDAHAPPSPVTDVAGLLV